jgi:hypothetical protein
VIADFSHEDEATTLATDLRIDGSVRPAAAPRTGADVDQ